MTNNTIANAWCSALNIASYEQIVTRNYENCIGVGTANVAIGNKTIDDAASFKSEMSGVQFCYELATPITYQLTESEISGILSTLYGTNNIWSSTGDTEVTYPADTKLYIDGKIADAIAALNS
jgi:hypothetical protein